MLITLTGPRNCGYGISEPSQCKKKHYSYHPNYGHGNPNVEGIFVYCPHDLWRGDISNDCCYQVGNLIY